MSSESNDPHPLFEAPVELDETETWIVSYADLMTLLFGFFSMMFTYAYFDDNPNLIRINKELAKYFGGLYMDPNQKTDQTDPIHSKHLKSPLEAQPGSVEQGKDVVSKDAKQKLQFSPYSENLTLKQSKDGVEITFITTFMFDSGKADLLPPMLVQLRGLIDLVHAIKAPSRIIIEGHTDDNFMESSQFPSNWELSAARASAIVRLFQASGFRANQLSAIGYGESRPLYQNRTLEGEPIAENQRLNRRVVIKVLPLHPEDSGHLLEDTQTLEKTGSH